MSVRSGRWRCVSVPKTPLRFGKVAGPGPKRLRAEVTARVLANCPFRMVASFQGLTQVANRTVVIPSGQIAVTINGREVPIGTDRVVIAGGGPTPPGGVNILIAVEMEIKGASACPAGQYGGDLTLTQWLDRNSEEGDEARVYRPILSDRYYLTNEMPRTYGKVRSQRQPPRQGTGEKGGTVMTE